MNLWHDDFPDMTSLNSKEKSLLCQSKVIFALGFRVPVGWYAVSLRYDGQNPR